jgi:plastocyanin
MRNARIPMMLFLGVCVLWATADPIEVAADRGGDQKIALVDDCDPKDVEGWAPVGCLQRKGDVTAAEFDEFLQSSLYDNDPDNDPSPTDPLAGLFLVGHPSWRNEPSHVVIEAGKRLQITNEGGRPHTFTKVAEFGGGRIPPLRVGTQMAPECAPPPMGVTDPYQVLPGERLKLKATGEGIMRFQCCFHPWMRATVRVKPDDDHHGHDRN